MSSRLPIGAAFGAYVSVRRRGRGLKAFESSTNVARAGINVVKRATPALCSYPVPTQAHAARLIMPCEKPLEVPYQTFGLARPSARECRASVRLLCLRGF